MEIAMGLNYKAVQLNNPKIHRDLPRSPYGVKTWYEVRNGLYEPLYVLTKVGDIRYVQNRDRNLTYEGVVIILHIQFDTGGSVDIKSLSSAIPQIPGCELLLKELEESGRFYKGATLDTGTTTLSLEWKVDKEEFSSGLILYIKELEVAMSINYNRTHHIEHPLDATSRRHTSDFNVLLESHSDCTVWLKEGMDKEFYVIVDDEVERPTLNIIPGESFVSYNGRTLSIDDAMRGGILFKDRLSATRCRNVYSDCGVDLTDMTLPTMIKLLESMSVEIKGIVSKDKTADISNQKANIALAHAERKADIDLEQLHRGAAVERVKDDIRVRTLADSYERDKVVTLIKDTQDLNSELNAARKQTTDSVKAVVDISKKVAGAF